MFLPLLEKLIMMKTCRFNTLVATSKIREFFFSFFFPFLSWSISSLFMTCLDMLHGHFIHLVFSVDLQIQNCLELHKI